jgi:hypothetical protein
MILFPGGCDARNLRVRGPPMPRMTWLSFSLAPQTTGQKTQSNLIYSWDSPRSPRRNSAPESTCCLELARGLPRRRELGRLDAAISHVSPTGARPPRGRELVVLLCIDAIKGGPTHHGVSAGPDYLRRWRPPLHPMCPRPPPRRAPLQPLLREAVPPPTGVACPGSRRPDPTGYCRRA